MKVWITLLCLNMVYLETGEALSESICCAWLFLDQPEVRIASGYGSWDWRLCIKWQNRSYLMCTRALLHILELHLLAFSHLTGINIIGVISIYRMFLKGTGAEVLKEIVRAFFLGMLGKCPYRQGLESSLEEPTKLVNEKADLVEALNAAQRFVLRWVVPGVRILALTRDKEHQHLLFSWWPHQLLSWKSNWK